MQCRWQDALFFARAGFSDSSPPSTSRPVGRRHVCLLTAHVAVVLSCGAAMALDHELSNCVRACGRALGCRFSVFLVLSSESGSVVAVHEAALLSTHRAKTHQQVEHRRPRR